MNILDRITEEIGHLFLRLTQIALIFIVFLSVGVFFWLAFSSTELIVLGVVAVLYLLKDHFIGET
ncbi:MAG: hypothetical protein KZQ83_12505 [gamma proteobacterium symbiont of Taylorina sp.]|nr:hypothetical protein [gamma proteobacterium symbiont of Taylorina sp.]